MLLFNVSDALIVSRTKKMDAFISSVLRVFTACSLCCYLSTAAPVVTTESKAIMYLQKYGYMEKTMSSSSSIVDEKAFSDAIKDFQRLSGLSETGILDKDTLDMMSMPRCGVSDKVGHSGSTQRRKRYALEGSSYLQESLAYRIAKYPTSLKDRAKVDKEIAKALKVWSDVSGMNFEVSNGPSHIEIRFEKGKHGDGLIFDGPGGTLAHAFFPIEGSDVHFDDEEKWTLQEDTGKNLLQVAAHEFGHSLGLAHSKVKTAVMYPHYLGYKPNFTLDKDDILGIQKLYGPPKEKAKPESKPQTNPDVNKVPDLCQNSSIDAATVTEDGRAYVFKGNYYWKIELTGISDGYPRKIFDDWSGLPGNLDAALTWTKGKTFFFKKNLYWRFRNKDMDSGYPKNISDGFPGIPNDVDAAFVWSTNQKSYFFKGDKFWRYDSEEQPVASRYPQPISYWNALPNSIDAGFRWSNNTYLFKGSQYYRLNDKTPSVVLKDPPYPRSTYFWIFDCENWKKHL